MTNDKPIDTTEIEALETEDQKITRMALDWIDAGKSEMPPKSIRKRVRELRPSNKAIKELTAVQKREQRVIRQKNNLDMFLEAFLKNGGNPTQAAKDVLGIKTNQHAAMVGQRYLEQAKLIGRLVLEQKGYHMGKMLDIAAQKMEESKNPDWWDRLMKIADYSNPIADKKNVNQTVNIFQTQKRDAEDYGFDDVIEGEMVGEEEDSDPA